MAVGGLFDGPTKGSGKMDTKQKKDDECCTKCGRLLRWDDEVFERASSSTTLRSLLNATGRKQRRVINQCVADNITSRSESRASRRWVLLKMDLRESIWKVLWTRISMCASHIGIKILPQLPLARVAVCWQETSACWRDNDEDTWTKLPTDRPLCFTQPSREVVVAKTWTRPSCYDYVASLHQTLSLYCIHTMQASFLRGHELYLPCLCLSRIPWSNTWMIDGDSIHQNHFWVGERNGSPNTMLFHG